MAVPADRGGVGAGGQQQRRRHRPRPPRPLPRQGGGHLPRPDHRDRRQLPHPRHHGRERRRPPRGGHHQHHPPRRLRAAIGPATGVLLRAHTSNCRVSGFTKSVPLADLVALGRKHPLPVLDDIGSGALLDFARLGLRGGPDLRASVAAGADLVLFSGDKLLGGPQAGVLVGRAEAVERAKRHPLARALRIDKLSLAALEALLRVYRDGRLDAVPVLRMLTASESALEARAERLAAAIPGARVVRASAKVGGGALPLLELEGPVCAVDPGELGADELARRLRAGEPPVIGRTREGWLLLDPRTLTDGEADEAARAASAALAG
jgi:L-seryl-tRNA(Ser) seleniumtransferase